MEPNCPNKMLPLALISPVMLIKLLNLSVPLFLLFFWTNYLYFNLERSISIIVRQRSITNFYIVFKNCSKSIYAIYYYDKSD